MKIAIITSGYYPVIDGVTVSIHNRLKVLSRLGHEVLVLCPDYKGLSVYKDLEKHIGEIMPNVFVRNVPSSKFMGLDFEMNICAKANKVIFKELEKFAPDVIHVDEPERIWSGTLKRVGIEYAKIYKIPCTAFYHTNFIDYLEDYIKVPKFVIKLLQFVLRRLFKYIYNAYDKTLLSGTVALGKVKGFGINNTKFDNYCGVDLDLSSSIRKQSNFFKNKYNMDTPDEKVKLIFIGRLTEDKNWYFTISALHELIKIIGSEKIEIFFVGDGPLKSEIESKLTSRFSNIHLMGRLPQNELYALVKNCEIHISTSVKETRGLTSIESMAAGVPVITPRAGGFIDDVIPGYNGYLFVPNNKKDFVRKCKLLIENAELRLQMAENCKKYSQNFEWGLCVNRLLNAWNECILAIKDETPSLKAG